MTCPQCSHYHVTVRVTRPADVATMRELLPLNLPLGIIAVKRRRYCEGCGHRYTTVEVEPKLLLLVRDWTKAGATNG